MTQPDPRDVRIAELETRIGELEDEDKIGDLERDRNAWRRLAEQSTEPTKAERIIEEAARLILPKVNAIKEAQSETQSLKSERDRLKTELAIVRAIYAHNQRTIEALVEALERIAECAHGIMPIYDSMSGLKATIIGLQDASWTRLYAILSGARAALALARSTAPMTQPDAPAPSQAPEHSPTPWELVEATEYHGPYIVSSYGGNVCDFYVMSNPAAPSIRNGGTSHPILFNDAVENAAFVTKAVNAYEANQRTIEALVAALEPFAEAASVLEREYEHQMQPETGCNIKFSALCAARAALALAGERGTDDRSF